MREQTYLPPGSVSSYGWQRPVLFIAAWNEGRERSIAYVGPLDGEPGRLRDVAGPPAADASWAFRWIPPSAGGRGVQTCP